jgi:transposase
MFHSVSPWSDRTRFGVYRHRIYFKTYTTGHGCHVFEQRDYCWTTTLVQVCDVTSWLFNLYWHSLLLYMLLEKLKQWRSTNTHAYPPQKAIKKNIQQTSNSRRVWRYQREVITIRKSKKNRQHNGQKKRDKRTNNDQQNIDIKLKTEKHEPHLKSRVNSGDPEAKQTTSCRLN